jgi:hypothetical protein
MGVLVLVLLLIGAVLFGIRIVWGDPGRPDLLTAGLFCWLAAVIVEHIR